MKQKTLVLKKNSLLFNLTYTSKKIIISAGDKVQEFLKNYGYPSKAYEMIKNSYVLKSYKEETLLKKVKIIILFLEELEFTKQDIIRITLENPPIFAYTITSLAERYCNLLFLGFPKSRLALMIKKSPQLLNVSAVNMNMRIKELETLGFDHSKIIRMIYKEPCILKYSFNNISNKIDEFIKLGIPKEKVIKMVSFAPAIFSRKMDVFKERIVDLETLGFNKNQIIKIISNLPNILVYSLDNIKVKILELEKIGFSHKEVINMLASAPTLFSNNKETIMAKIAVLNKFFTEEETKRIILDFPQIFNFSVDSLFQKMDIYSKNGVIDLITSAPKRLMQSTELTLARLELFNSLNVSLELVSKNLFACQKDFVRRFGFTNAETLECKQMLLKKEN